MEVNPRTVDYTGRTKRILTFATRSDYEPVIQAIEERRHLQYVLNGSFREPTPSIVYSALELDSLGVATRGDTISEEQYDVLDAEKKVSLQERPQNNGTMRYLVPNNPESITVIWGGLFDGIYEKKGGAVELPAAIRAMGAINYHTPKEDVRLYARCMIAGDIATKSTHPDAIALLRLFRREIQKRFTRVQEFWVGPEAMTLLQTGMRFTMGIQSPTSADLRVDGTTTQA